MKTGKNFTHIYPFDLENELAKVYLLIMRKDYSGAQAALDQLSRAGVPATEIDPLLAKMRQQQAQSNQVAESRRSLRYTLGLQTTSSRIWWFGVVVAITFYSLWNGAYVINLGQARGFSTIITTHVYLSGRGQPYAWTHPIYMDVVYSGVLLTVAIVAIVIIARVSRDAAQWEELDATTQYRR